MKKIEAKIERSTDGTYSVYCLQEKFSGMGNTAEEAKKDMIEQMQFFKKTAQEIGFSYPDFLDNEFEVVFKFDPDSLLEYYAGILSLAGLEKVTGIHQKQLWSYLHRKSKPRKSQMEKIEKGLHALGSELMSISL
ncbi:MAG: hypothetical protein VB046_04950 [Paludibacter sp.]|jgi:predicted RNase H-like HicB family nuclease|nr:hypothetical protein [Paludibacter sp.]